MTTREHFKYYGRELYDKLGKRVVPGDTVIINSHYGATPYIGIVDHYTESGRLAVLFDWNYGSSRKVKLWAYRDADKVIKFKNGNKHYIENKLKGKS